MKKNNDFTANFTIVPNCLIRNPNISMYAKGVYSLLKSYSPSFPSYSKIQAATGIGSRTTISRCLDELTQNNYIKRVYNSNHNSTLYEFIINRVDRLSRLDGTEVVVKEDSNKNKLIIPNNNLVSSPAPPVEDTLNTQEILSKAFESLGPDAGKNFKEKVRPTFNPNTLG